jgi:hypothetical protein
MRFDRTGLVVIPVRSVSSYETSNAFGVDFLASHSKDSLLAPRSPLLLFANHDIDFLGFDVLSNVPGR